MMPVWLPLVRKLRIMHFSICTDWACRMTIPELPTLCPSMSMPRKVTTSVVPALMMMVSLNRRVDAGSNPLSSTHQPFDIIGKPTGGQSSNDGRAARSLRGARRIAQHHAGPPGTPELAAEAVGILARVGADADLIEGMR